MSQEAQQLARKVIEYIATHEWRQISYFHDDLELFMSDPQGLVRLVQKEAGLSQETIDAWAAEAQYRHANPYAGEP